MPWCQNVVSNMIIINKINLAILSIILVGQIQVTHSMHKKSLEELQQTIKITEDSIKIQKEFCKKIEDPSKKASCLKVIPELEQKLKKLKEEKTIKAKTAIKQKTKDLKTEITSLRKQLKKSIKFSEKLKIRAKILKLELKKAKQIASFTTKQTTQMKSIIKEIIRLFPKIQSLVALSSEKSAEIRSSSDDILTLARKVKNSPEALNQIVQKLQTLISFTLPVIENTKEIIKLTGNNIIRKIDEQIGEKVVDIRSQLEKTQKFLDKLSIKKIKLKKEVPKRYKDLKPILQKKENKIKEAINRIHEAIKAISEIKDSIDKIQKEFIAPIQKQTLAFSQATNPGQFTRAIKNISLHLQKNIIVFEKEAIKILNQGTKVIEIFGILGILKETRNNMQKLRANLAATLVNIAVATAEILNAFDPLIDTTRDISANYVDKVIANFKKGKIKKTSKTK